jgi:putative membrane protein
LVLGIWLWLGFGFSGQWLMWKLVLVVLLVIYHGWCLQALRAFREDRNKRSHIFYRLMNELPVLGLVGIILLVTLKPS